MAALARKAEAAVVVKLSPFVPVLLAILSLSAYAQDLPDNELQVNLNTYFDSFNVQVVYPSVSLTKRLDESSSINVRYLVDLVTAASIRSQLKADNAISRPRRGGEREDDDRESGVDGVTSASGRGEGGYRPDDVRQEVGFGITRSIIQGTLSVNALYSKEFDYRSETVAGTFSYPFAKKNTTFQLGFVRSWDANFPKIFDWTKHKNEYTFSATLTQILSKRLISQAIFSYDHAHGLLSDPYEVVQIRQGNEVQNLEPIHPELRIRKAAGWRLNYKAGRQTALHLGFRYYWDDWKIRSFTTSISLDQHVNDYSTIGFGVRNYLQGRAFFFKEHYDVPEPLMTVDSKLDRGYSNELEFKLSLNGGEQFEGVPFLMNENVQFNMLINLYHRHTATPNWFSGSRNLFSLIMSFGIRYRF